MENKVLPPARNDSLPLAEMKKIVADCFAPNPWIYWADLLLTAAVAYASFVFTELVPTLSWQEIALFAVSVFAFYRGMIFTHEVSHQERRDLPGFSIVWNFLFGIPMLLPSFMYRGVHIDHHRKATYGTHEDGEYLPFGASPIWRSVIYLGQSILLPFLIVFRFGLLAPLSLFHPRFRHFVMTHASAVAIRMDTERKLPPPGSEDLRNWYVQEALCFVFVLVAFVFFYTGVLSLGTLRHWYLLMVTVAFVNSVRTVVAHRYRNRTEREVTFTEQFLDSVNIEGGPGMELLAPVSLRYHALHHVFANIPYHNLGIAHRRLKAQLPADSIYHQSTEPCLFSALHTHWKNTRAAQTEENEARGTFRA